MTGEMYHEINEGMREYEELKDVENEVEVETTPIDAEEGCEPANALDEDLESKKKYKIGDIIEGALIEDYVSKPDENGIVMIEWIDYRKWLVLEHVKAEDVDLIKRFLYGYLDYEAEEMTNEEIIAELELIAQFTECSLFEKREKSAAASGLVQTLLLKLLRNSELASAKEAAQLCQRISTTQTKKTSKK